MLLNFAGRPAVGVGNPRQVTRLPACQPVVTFDLIYLHCGVEGSGFSPDSEIKMLSKCSVEQRWGSGVSLSPPTRAAPRVRPHDLPQISSQNPLEILSRHPHDKE